MCLQNRNCDRSWYWDNPMGYRREGKRIGAEIEKLVLIIYDNMQMNDLKVV